MFVDQNQSKRATEASLIVICGALTLILYLAIGFKMVVLNMFYLPVVLAAFYLGRHRASILAFFSVMLATIVAVADLSSFAGQTSQLVIGVSLIVWAGVMGLNALFVGTLSDERGRKIEELHDAYLGVVEVLAQYLKSADPSMNDQSKRVSALSQEVARRMRLSEREVDDIRVAALLQDIDNIEVTARVIHRAVDDLQHSRGLEPHTFHGGDLLQSLGSVLTGSLSLIVGRDDGLELSFDEDASPRDVPVGAAIIRAVRQYDVLTCRADHPLAPTEALDAMRIELDGDYHPGVLNVLEQIARQPADVVTDRLQLLEKLVAQTV
ncbi:MAG: HD domain-containing phosphohydrolase [Pirellulaceae bacterium]